MNKTELVDQLAQILSKSKKDSEILVNAFLDSVEEALAKGDKVQLVGFGTFEVRERQARSGRNPQTGEVISIPGGQVPAFKPGKALKDAVK